MYELSVIMPIYNAEKYLKNAVDSLLNQTFKNIEIILIDDGSKDKSDLICDEYNIYPNVKVVHKANGGLCAARNDGLKLATGKYITFMDNDDYILPETYEENLKLLNENQADWVKFGKEEILVSQENVLANKKTNFNKAVYIGDEILHNLFSLKAENAMTFVWDSIFNLELIRKHNIHFDERFKTGNEDIDFCEKYALHCNKLVVNDKCYYKHYTRYGISASSKYSKDKIDSYIYLLNKENKRYEENDLFKGNEVLYEFITAKQIIYNLCNKLNDASDLSFDQKVNWLSEISESKEFGVFNSDRKSHLLNKSKKLYVYSSLFKKKKFGLLLKFDEKSRKMILRIRNIKRKKVCYE